ncbi:MAG: hypothetical protein ABG776_16750 [Cyanobacteria bacterium J06555_13]
MKTQACLAFTALAIALTGAPATAATFSYDVTDAAVHKKNIAAGTFDAISTTFNDVTNQFTWSSTFGYNADKETLAESAWLVVNDGPHPNKKTSEHIIFYLDGVNKKVTAYNYDDTKGAKSWRTTNFLGTEDLAVATTPQTNTLSFSWDLSSINNLTDKFGDTWQGAAFDEKIGIWFQAAAQSDINYAEDGRLTKFKLSGPRSYYDVNKRSATSVLDDETQDIPEPGMIMALGMTAAAAAFTKRRNAYA